MRERMKNVFVTLLFISSVATAAAIKEPSTSMLLSGKFVVQTRSWGDVLIAHVQPTLVADRTHVTFIRLQGSAVREDSVLIFEDAQLQTAPDAAYLITRDRAQAIVLKVAESPVNSGLLDAAEPLLAGYKQTTSYSGYGLAFQQGEGDARESVEMLADAFWGQPLPGIQGPTTDSSVNCNSCDIGGYGTQSCSASNENFSCSVTCQAPNCACCKWGNIFVRPSCGCCNCNT